MVIYDEIAKCNVSHPFEFGGCTEPIFITVPTLFCTVLLDHLTLPILTPQFLNKGSKIYPKLLFL